MFPVGEQWMIKWGGDERDARESSPQPGKRLRGDTVTGGKKTGRTDMRGKDMGEKATGAKEMGGRETGGKATGARETEGKAMGAKGTKASAVNATGAQDSQETGGKGAMVMGEMEMDNMLLGDMTAGQNATEAIYSEVVIEGVRR